MAGKFYAVPDGYYDADFDFVFPSADEFMRQQEDTEEPEFPFTMLVGFGGFLVWLALIIYLLMG